MWPATPTPIPAGTPWFEPVPDSYGLWAAAPAALQVWNHYSDFAWVLQLALLLMIIAAGIFVLFRFVTLTTRRDSEE